MPATHTGGGPEAFEMTDRAAAAMLRSHGHGTLSLADGGEAYAVPMSYGYDGDCYFVFRQPREQSRKVAAIEATERAALLVTDVRSKHDWASVLAEGPVEEVPDAEWDSLLAALEGNAWFPSVFSETDPMQRFRGYRLVPERVTGRRGADYEAD
jgi:nitroimidazol reductase NimA-like FMN-containing flavoprotein (pyridoxamine 5'-phosphate oxidase superfamily)